MSEFTEIIAEVRAGAGIVRFNRPAARNALTDTMMSETMAALATWEMDPAIVGVIVTGDETAFCAGGDVKGTAASQMDPFEKYRHRYIQSVWHDSFRKLARYTKPLIAAVEGHAYGGGLELLLRCDFAVGSETAKMGMTEARLGLFPILGGAYLLAEAVGPRMARELCFTGRKLSASEAHALGILNHVTPPGGAVDYAANIVEDIAGNAPLAVMAAKQAIARSRHQSFDEALSEGGDLSALLMFSQDRKEGLQAFLDKRKPEFKGE
ncbi:MAG: enoyl-CoA hydratase/isomerase family protein [Pseudomonadota bacterium]